MWARRAQAGRERPALRSGHRARERRLGVLLIIPSLCLLVTFTLGPFAEAIRLSFHRLTFARDAPGLESHFVGLRNYAELARSPAFLVALRNTVIWVVGSVLGRVAFALVLALLLKRRLPLVGLFRALALIPWVMPVPVAGVMWRWIFSGEWGVLNAILRGLGLIDTNIIWMSAPGFRWFYMISLTVWREYPLPYVVILARLQGIPRELYEAARIDGAGAWASFWHVTLPLLRPILYVLGLLAALWTATDFGSVWMLTGRGTTLATLAYSLAFRSWYLGRGSAVGVYLALMLGAVTWLYIRALRRGLA